MGRLEAIALYPLKNTVIFIEEIMNLYLQRNLPVKCKRIWKLFCFCNSCTIEDATL